MKKMMNKIVAGIVLMMCWMPAFGQREMSVVIVNGHFFTQWNKVLKAMGMPSDLQVFGVATPEGNNATCYYSESTAIPPEFIKDSLSAENVEEGEELLRRYHVQIARNKKEKELAGTMEPLQIGASFPSFKATDINGREWTNKDVENRVMVLNLWFTGCRPCIKEMPELSTWKDEMPEVMFFSATYEEPEIAKKVLDKTNFNWIALVNDDFFSNWMGPHGYPLTIIVDKTGKIAAFEYGTSAEKRKSLKDKISSLR